ncbi:MAG: sulfotransferase [Deltaproteobacteria bacterium]|nr:sulfotransferase [Deltaproteobacteria bacterium]
MIHNLYQQPMVVLHALPNKVLSLLDALLASALKERWRGEKIDRPIFIIGVERSGTTLLYSLLANHPDLYWLSRLDSAIPGCPLFSSVIRRLVAFGMSRAIYVAIPGTISRSQGLMPPSECLPYWRRIFGWGTEDNYLIPDDRFIEKHVTDDMRKHLYRDLRIRTNFSGKKRMLFKQPGLSLRTRFINDVFPDAIFLHVIRDPVANWLSLVGAKKSSRERFWGIKIPGWQQLLQEPIEVQAALQIQKTLEFIEYDVQEANAIGRYIQVRYESLINHPQRTLNDCVRFCGLKWQNRLDKAIQGVQAISRSDILPENIPEEAKKILFLLREKYRYA